FRATRCMLAVGAVEQLAEAVLRLLGILAPKSQTPGHASPPADRRLLATAPSPEPECPVHLPLRADGRIVAFLRAAGSDDVRIGPRWRLRRQPRPLARSRPRASHAEVLRRRG